MKRDKMFSKECTRLGWCKKGDWNGRLPKGSKGGTWNAPCDCVRPSVGAWLHEEGIDHMTNPQDSKFLSGGIKTAKLTLGNSSCRVNAVKEAVLYYRNNSMTGKRGWW